MSSERSTSRPSRSRADARSSHAAKAANRDQTLLGDLTRPIPTERRLVQHPAVRWVVGAAALAVVVGLLAAMFVLPVETWRQQDAAIAAKQGQLEVLGQVNAKMAAEVGHLQTVDGARQAARDEMGLIGPGEQRRTIVSNDLASLALPSGFPYDAISQAIATRSVTGQP
ncbi:MAG: hypothetical protein RI958_1345 [Actinomycetota bacterium]